MEIQPDPDLDIERAEKLYDSLKAAKGRVPTQQEDIKFLVRAAVNVKVDPFKDDATRRKQLVELEELTRDLATQLQALAQKNNDTKTYLQAASAYKEYLSLFRPEKYVRDIMHNRADALFAAHSFPEAARQFEELELYEERAKNAPGAEAAAYGALLSHFSALKPGEVDKITAFEVADARQALKLDGAKFISKYPRNANALTVKFNIARAYLRRRRVRAVQPALHRLRHGIPGAARTPRWPASWRSTASGSSTTSRASRTTSRKFLGNGRLPAAFLADVRKYQSESKGEALGELALQSSAETGDVVEGLLKVAAENKGGDIAEKALYGAFTAAREKRDYAKEREIGAKLLTDYPKHCLHLGRADHPRPALRRVGALRRGRPVVRAARRSHGPGQLGLRRVDGGRSAAAGAQRLRRSAEGLPGRGQRRRRPARRGAGAAGADQAEGPRSGGRPGHRRAGAEGRQDQSPGRGGGGRGGRPRLPASGPTRWPRRCSRWSTRPPARARIRPRPSGTWGRSSTGTSRPSLRTRSTRRWRRCSSCRASTTSRRRWAARSGRWPRCGSWACRCSRWPRRWRPPRCRRASPAPTRSSSRPRSHQQVQPIKEQADEAFKTCLARAAQLEVYSPAVIGCRTRAETARSPLPPLPAPGNLPAGFAELQKKAEATQDAASLEALGMAYLDARQIPMAQLALARATELADARSTAQNALGVALLYQGEPMAARAAYGKALDADPSNEKARANLAALRCRYGDRDGAKKELSSVKAAALSGSDIDPEWRTCR